MAWFRKIWDSIIGSEDFSDIKSSTVRDLLNGDIWTKKYFRKQYKLILMISLLTFMYIGNRYQYENELAQVIRVSKEIKDAKYEALTISAQLMRLTRQSNIERMVRERGIILYEPDRPPVVVETPKQ